MASRRPDGRDAIAGVTARASRGSDPHPTGGFVPDMRRGDVPGHERVGEVVEVGRDNTKPEAGDRVVVPFTICRGERQRREWGGRSCRARMAGADAVSRGAPWCDNQDEGPLPERFGPAAWSACAA